MKKIVLSIAASAILLTTSDLHATEIIAGERAQAIAQRSLIIDTHIDVPWRLINDWEDVSRATERGDFDYERAVAGGLNAPFMAIYIPSRYETSGAYTARESINRLYGSAGLSRPR